MGSLGSRLRSPVHSTRHADVQTLRLDQTVVMEVRGRQIELQTKKAEWSKNRQPRRARRKPTGNRVDGERQPGTSVVATANHVGSSGPGDRQSEGTGSGVPESDDCAADNGQSSAEEEGMCSTTKMNDRETTDTYSCTLVTSSLYSYVV